MPQSLYNGLFVGIEIKHTEIWWQQPSLFKLKHEVAYSGLHGRDSYCLRHL
jgi:hypothetical protein